MALSEEVIARRLRAVDQSSESIQTTSMWILHHRDSVTQFVNCWTEVFKTANDPLQIALFYVANDVCQKAKKKGDSHVLLQAFAPHWITAIAYSRSSENVQKAVSRILEIFEERQIYSKSQLADMRAAQNDSNELEDNTLLDFDIGYLIRDVEGYHKGNLVMERARELLSRSDFNFRDKIKSRMKDRRDGEKFMGEIEQSYTKLTDFFGALAKHRKRGQHLLGETERAKRCFTLQLRDATVVEDAYQKFGSGLVEVCAEVEEMLKTGVYPGASPPRDAPSPTANDDPFREGVENAFKQMRGPQSDVAVLLPLPKAVQVKEDTIVTAASLQTNQTFKGSAQMLKLMEGIRGNETSKTNSSSPVVSDPRLASHPLPHSTAVPSTAVEPAVIATTTSPFSVHSQASSSGSVPPVTSAPGVLSQAPQMPSPQLDTHTPIPSVTPGQRTRAPPPNGNLAPWMFGPPPNFSAPPPGTAPRPMVNLAAGSGTTNSLQTPVVSSQLQGSRTVNTTTVAHVPGSQPAPLSTSPRLGLPLQHVPGLLPPPPPDMRPPLGVPTMNNFVPAAVPPYTGVQVSSAPSPATVPFPPGSFNVPPPRLMSVPPPISLNIPPPGVMDCSPPGTFPLGAPSSSPAGPIASRSFSAPSPSSSVSVLSVAATTSDLSKPPASGSNSSSGIDSAKGNGDLRHEARKRSLDYGTAADSRGDRRFDGFRSSGGDMGRGDLRDPRARDRDRERSGSNRGSQQQSYDSGGRRYSSDDRNRAPRYRDYDDDRRARRYEAPRGNFSRDRR